jgi:hypothetical protein
MPGSGGNIRSRSSCAWSSAAHSLGMREHGGWPCSPFLRHSAQWQPACASYNVRTRAHHPQSTVPTPKRTRARAHTVPRTPSVSAGGASAAAPGRRAVRADSFPGTFPGLPPVFHRPAPRAASPRRPSSGRARISPSTTTRPGPAARRHASDR